MPIWGAQAAGRGHRTSQLPIGRSKLLGGLIYVQTRLLDRIRLQLEHLRYALTLGLILGFLKSGCCLSYLLIESA
jgi:hypothetical protein